MKSIILSYTDIGGAGRAAININRSLKKNNIQSELFVKNKNTNLENVKTFYKKKLFDFDKFKEKINRNICKIEKKKIFSYQSPSLFPTNLSKRLNNSEFDIIHLCWINEFLSVEDIGKIKKPLVWSLCDMWPFSGINHYDYDGEEALWRKNNYSRKRKFSLDQWLINRKVNSWIKKINVVVPNKWMFDCVKDSKVMSNFNCEIIKWPIDNNFFSIKDKNLAKKKFNFEKKKLVLFACSNGLKDKRKGWKYLNKCLSMTNEIFDLIILSSKENYEINKNFKGKVIWIDKINNDLVLSDLYNSVDCLVLPSEHDNSPLVALEAQSCGLPIVTFDCNGMSEIVDHKEIGFKAEPYNIKQFAEGIDWALKNSDQKSMKDKILSKSKEYSMNIVGAKYTKLYKKILNYELY